MSSRPVVACTATIALGPDVALGHLERAGTNLDSGELFAPAGDAEATEADVPARREHRHAVGRFQGDRTPSVLGHQADITGQAQLLPVHPWLDDDCRARSGQRDRIRDPGQDVGVTP